MLLAVALLLQFPVFSSLQTSGKAGEPAAVSSAAHESTNPKKMESSASFGKQTVGGETLSADANLASVAFEPGRLVAEPIAPASPALAVPNASAASPITAEPLPIVPVYAAPMRIATEQRRRRREWLALSIAQHSAAGFDAWSTRRVLSSMDNAQEANPFLRPFAGNASMYAAVQVSPAIFD